MFCSAAQHLSNIYRVYLTLSQMPLDVWTPLAATTVFKMHIPSCFKPPDYSLCNLYLGPPPWKLGKAAAAPWPLCRWSLCRCPCAVIPAESPHYPCLSHTFPKWPACSRFGCVPQRAASSPSQRCSRRLAVGWIREAGCWCQKKGLGEEHEAFWPVGPPTGILNQSNGHRNTKTDCENSSI